MLDTPPHYPHKSQTHLSFTKDRWTHLLYFTRLKLSDFDIDGLIVSIGQFKNMTTHRAKCSSMYNDLISKMESRRTVIFLIMNIDLVSVSI